MTSEQNSGARNAVKFKFHPLSRLDASQAKHWYNQHRQGLGDEFLDEVDAIIARISVAPESFPIMESGIRRATLKKFSSYSIIFQPIDAETILRLRHSSFESSPSGVAETYEAYGMTPYRIYPAEVRIYLNSRPNALKIVCRNTVTD